MAGPGWKVLVSVASGGTLLVLVARCFVPAADETDFFPPGVGTAAWEARLEATSAMRLQASELVLLGRSECQALEGRLDELAGRVDPEKTWRQIYAELRQDFPRTSAAVVEAYRNEVRRATAFVRERRLVSLPEARLDVVETPDVLPRENYPLTAYLGYRLVVTTSLSPWPWKKREHLRNHCYACIAPLVVHEAVPGHHVSFVHTRLEKAFPSPEVEALAQAHFKNKFFYEGWAQYGEVVMLEEGYYTDPRQELAAWRMLLLRAVRLWMDPQLHSGEMLPEDAVRYLESHLVMNREAARAEVRRHLVEPVMKTSYYVGMLQLLQLRRVLAEDPDFSMQAFHDTVLKWPLPIPTLAEIHFGVRLQAPGPGDGLQREGVSR